MSVVKAEKFNVTDNEIEGVVLGIKGFEGQEILIVVPDQATLKSISYIKVPKTIDWTQVAKCKVTVEDNDE